MCIMLSATSFYTFSHRLAMFLTPLFVIFNKAVENMARTKRVLDEDFRTWKGRAEQKKVELQLTNRALALRAGLSLSQVNQYMGGTYPNDNPREPIERALGMR